MLRSPSNCFSQSGITDMPKTHATVAVAGVCALGQLHLAGHFDVNTKALGWESDGSVSMHI